MFREEDADVVTTPDFVNRVDVVFEAQFSQNLAEPNHSIPYEKIYRLTVFGADNHRISAMVAALIKAYPGEGRRVRRANLSEDNVIHLILADAMEAREALQLATSTRSSLLALVGQSQPMEDCSHDVVVLRSAGDEAARLALGLFLPKQSLICLDFADVAALCRGHDVVVSAIPAEIVRCELAAIAENPSWAKGFILLAPGRPLLELEAIFDILRSNGDQPFEAAIVACDGGLAPTADFLFGAVGTEA